MLHEPEQSMEMHPVTTKEQQRPNKHDGVTSERALSLPAKTQDTKGQSDQPEASSSRSKWATRSRRGLQIFVQNWFLIGLGVLIVLAWRFPDVGKNGGWIKPEYTIHYGAIALIFLITGFTLSTPALFSQAKNFKLHLITQVISLIIYPSFLFGLCNLMKATDTGGQIDPYVLLGLVFLGCACTSVASNITFTREGGGSTEAATIQVVIGNILGIFFTPLLVEMYTSTAGWEYAKPVAEGGLTGSEGLQEIYKQVSKQMCLSLILPLIVGQVIQYVFPKPVKWLVQTFYLTKVSSFMVLAITWSVFSNQFATGAFSSVPPASIILVVFLNIGLYFFFTAFCIFSARLPLVSRHTILNGRQSRLARSQSYKTYRQIVQEGTAQWVFTKQETTAICYCAAAKGLVVGTPVLQILYGGFTAKQQAIIAIPLALYQGEQVALAQLLTFLFRRWNAQPDRLFPNEEVVERQTEENPSPQEGINKSTEGQMHPT